MDDTCPLCRQAPGVMWLLPRTWPAAPPRWVCQACARALTGRGEG
jgi:hypothetical protein